MIIIKVITPADAIKTSFLVIFIFGAELITLANKSIAAEIIKANKVAQNEGAYKSKAMSDAKGYRVARLPNIVLHQLAKKGILSITGQVLDKPRFFKWLNDSDNRHFRIYTGNL